MKKYYCIIVFLFFVANVFAQKKPIEFKTENRKNTLLVYGYNNMSKPLEITLSIKDIEGLHGYIKPITKKVPAYGKQLFARLTYKNTKYKYKLSHTFKKPKATNKSKRRIAYEQRVLKANKKTYYLKDFSKINEGIVVFDDGNCGRTALVTNYLIGNNIDFKIINTAKRPKNERLMWQTIKEKGASLNVQTPVIIVNGVLSHSHKDLQGFIEGLKKNADR